MRCIRSVRRRALAGDGEMRAGTEEQVTGERIKIVAEHLANGSASRALPVPPKGKSLCQPQLKHVGPGGLVEGPLEIALAMCAAGECEFGGCVGDRGLGCAHDRREP
jgi:hypothetical protein